jgi:hypothetical protein
MQMIRIILLTGASPLADAALCNLLFRTSAGAQTVVATVPAANEAAIWTGTPSETLSILLDRTCLLTDVYLISVSIYQQVLSLSIHSDLRNISLPLA